ncbi:signal peptidase II [Caldinitratiruptor microaerophilus]|uniref:Lipoprotein signal peptidase n=1 Tax=Caldinitratiruptor microaerophilus TaxID=671077 RepID=A0AA35G9X2_9FIRM|nr:signal peptidase II [Caldinitratiruptor microaerophilus]BDG60724.1 lipoprotein signal peptidase [Caldinitratiruptor microaerophilus]
MRTILVGLLALVVDMASKSLVAARLALGETIPVIPGFFQITYVLNPGAAFGLLPHQRELFIAVSVGAVLLILYHARRPEGQVGVLPYAMGLMLGGAAGNLADRVRLGRVVDFLDFYWRDWHYPVFNLADVSIVLGVGLFLLHHWREGRRG